MTPRPVAGSYVAGPAGGLVANTSLMDNERSAPSWGRFHHRGGGNR